MKAKAVATCGCRVWVTRNREYYFYHPPPPLLKKKKKTKVKKKNMLTSALASDVPAPAEAPSTR